jgi:hypothetical protein
MNNLQNNDCLTIPYFKLLYTTFIYINKRMECNMMYFISYVLEFIKRGIEKKEIYNFIIIRVSFTLGRIVIPNFK